MSDIHANPDLMRESAVAVMRALGMEPDPWQIEAMVSGHKQLLLNCCRQAGKSTTVAVLSLLEAVGNPGTKVLLLSRSFRQSQELFRQVVDYHQRLGSKFLAGKTADELEYLVIRAFEIDPFEPAMVRYPYEVSLFGEKVEEIDGAVHLSGLSCLIESKDWGKNVEIGPIVKMRSQLIRRPAGTIGLMFSKKTFTKPAIYVAHFTMPQAVLLWSGFDLQIAMDEGRICEFLRLKHRICCEDGIPDYDLRERSIP